MKFLLALSALLAFASAADPEGCEDCKAVVMTLSAYLTSQESVNNQVDLLLAEVCPQAQSPDDCVEKLPAFWGRVAMVMWPGYYNPEAEWMCATEEICGAPGTR
jgi:hypothetical protein